MLYQQKSFTLPVSSGEDPRGVCGACVWGRGPHVEHCIKVKKLKEELGLVMDKYPSPPAYVEHTVTDQGNGAAYCGSCNTPLGTDPFKVPSVCPSCGRLLQDSGRVYISQGGSDF